MIDQHVSPANVAMLVQGTEDYGIGTIEKQYAEFWPEITLVCLTTGPMYDWLRERHAKIELVEGMAALCEKSKRTLADADRDVPSEAERKAHS